MMQWFLSLTPDQKFLTLLLVFLVYVLCHVMYRLKFPIPPRPKEKHDVGKVKVTVVSVDSSSDFDIEFEGRFDGFFCGEACFTDALDRARWFIKDDTRPIRLPEKDGYYKDKEIYVPRTRVHRYIIGKREEHIIEY